MKKQILVLMLSVAAIMVGCNKSDVTGNYVNVSDNSCSFNHEGGVATVAISADGAWRAEKGADWVTLSENSSSITITADANNNRAERICEITVISGSASSTITVYQQGNTKTPVIYRKVPTSIFSPSGKYAAGLRTDIENNQNVTYLVLLDLKTEKEYYYGPYNRDTYPISKVHAVADNGDMYLIGGKNTSLSPTYFFNRAKASIEYFSAGGVFQCSADGTVAVGYIHGKTTSFGVMEALPTKWVNGKEIILDKPEKPYIVDEWFAGLYLRQCSADGKIVYGTEWQNSDHYMIWWDENNDWHYVAADVYKTEELLVTDKNGNEGYIIMAKGMINHNATTAMSSSGEWVAGWYAENVVRDSGAIGLDLYPGFYNILENKTYIFWDIPNGYGITVTNDGIGFVRTNAALYNSDTETSDYYAVDIRSGNIISSAQQWYFDTYGIYPPAKAVPWGFSPDGTVAMFTNAYIADLR